MRVPSQMRPMPCGFNRGPQRHSSLKLRQKLHRPTPSIESQSIDLRIHMCAHSKVALTILCAALALVVAPANSQQTGAPQSAPASVTCNTAAAAIGGALLGSLLGGKKNRVAGAAIGGSFGAAACLAVNYHARQTKSAQQVNQEFQQAHGGSLQPHATLVRYDTKFDPTDRVQPGGS